MAHFAQLDENNVVLQVIVVADEDTSDNNGVENEAIGVAFCQNLFGGTWKQTSYNNKIRKNYAGIGYSYDEALDAFIAPQPFNSWILNNDTAQWEAPVPYPTEPLPDGLVYIWDESNVTWKVLKRPE